MKHKQMLAVHFLLDSSGSMGSHRDSAIRGFNGFITELASAITPCNISLSTFASSKPRPVIVNQPVFDMPRLGYDTYRTGGGTALYGAMIWGLDALAKVSSKQKALVVLTDGQDGDVTTLKVMAQRVKEAQAKGWLVVFLTLKLGKEYDGDDMKEYRDAMAERQASMGIPPDLVLAYDMSNLDKVMATAAHAVLRFGSTNDTKAAAFTAEERAGV